MRASLRTNGLHYTESHNLTEVTTHLLVHFPLGESYKLRLWDYMKNSTPSKLKVAFSTTKPLPVLLLDSRLLGGSWVVISAVMRPLIWVITIVGLLMTHF